jgi:hypothetical protein
MKRVAIASLILLACVIVTPGIYVMGNAFLLLAEPEYSVPNASSIITFDCTKISEGGNTSYCDFGRDWTSYYAACGSPASGLASCSSDFASYPRAAAKKCSGFNPHDATTWCPQER